MRQPFAASLVLALTLALAAPLHAADNSPHHPPSPSDEIQALRQEIETMRANYEARLQALEMKLNAAQAQAAATPAPTAPAPALTPEPTEPPLVASTQNASPAVPEGSANAFNPQVSLILSGNYTQTSKDPTHYLISGFQLPKGADVGPGSRGFNLDESELGLSGNIDPWLRGAINIALRGDNSVSVEEAFVQTTSMGHGLTLKAGRFFSGVGYLNSQHSHTWDFVDNPLAYQALLGTQYGDDGVQLNWLAPLDQYVELGAELGRGRSFPGSDSSRNGAGMAALTAHTGGDIGESQSWRAGLSVLNAKASDQSLMALNAAGSSVTNVFDGSTRVWVLDGVWKWAPMGNATQTNFKLQGEYLNGRRRGTLSYDVDGLNAPGNFSIVQSGWYLQGVYQFMPHWRVGLRTERLNAGRPSDDSGLASFAGSGYHPEKNSLMLDFSPSEFSRVRLQFAQDKAQQGVTDDQFFIQYQMSLGAHGAHSY